MARSISLERRNLNSDLYNSSEYKNLQRLIIDGSCVVFVGSGLSVGIYPSWEDLIKLICDRCGIEGIRAGQNVSGELLLEKADEAKIKNIKLYNQVLKDIFRPVVNRREAYELLMRSRFKFYMTTNFDPLLANETRKPEYECGGVYCYPDLPYRSNRAVYYIHGIVRHDDRSEPNIILGKKDFDVGYSSKRTLYSFLHQIFTYESVLFIGCRLREPQLREIFRICHETRKEIESFHNVTGPTRYILLPYTFKRITSFTNVKRDENAEEQETSRFQELGITEIRYDPKDGQHSGLEELLRDWCQLPPINILRGFNFGEP